MKYILSLCMILCGVSLYAQQLTKGEKRIKVGEPGVFKDGHAALISDIRIINACADSGALGFAPADAGNETYRLVPDDQDRQWLNKFVAGRYGGAFNSAGARLLWVITDLSMTTDSAAVTHFARVRADVYREDQTAFRKILSLDTLFSSRVTDSEPYSPALISVLDQLYVASGNALQKRQPDGAPAAVVTEDAILAQTSGDKALPVLQTAKAEKGAYLSFDEFRNNAPSIIGPVWATADLSRGKGYVKVFTLKEDSTVYQLTSIWGVCFGGNELYKYEGGRLLPIEQSGKGFILSRYQQPEARKNQAIYWRRIAAGSWPDDTNPYSRDQALTMPVNKGSDRRNIASQPVATKIDMTTGALKF